MIYFLYGEDSYRSKEKLADIIEGYKKVHKSGLNLLYIDAKNNNFDDFYANFKINSMFAEKKLIILKNVFGNTKFQEDFLENLKKLEEIKDIVVVYESEKVDQRTKFFKALIKNVKAQEFNFLQPANLRKWIEEEFSAQGGPASGWEKTTITPDAIDLLTNYVKSDLWRMSQEVNKLANYKRGSVVEKEDIELQIRPDIENDIFKTIEAMASRNKKQALHLFHKHIENGDNALYLLTMIAYQFRNLIILKELSEKRLPYPVIVKKSGLHPFVVQKTFSMANKFSMEELKNIYKKIFATDAEIKTGQVEPEMSLDLLLSEI
jgi:DNA polymerase-3 subunit delta